MRVFSLLRGVALLRRIALVLEEGNALQREALALGNPEWARTKGLRKPSKMVKVEVPTAEEWNQAWREGQGLPPEG